MNAINIIGWGKIVPQLSAFFAVLRRRPNGLTPFNLFVSGRPGTNKSEGFEALVKYLGYSAFRVDASTLDDVSELAGVVDLKANRDEGQARLIEGEALKAQILILDEALNTRPHVVPQFRLFLQGELVLLGKRQVISNRAIIGMANLTEDMTAGEANLLDSPTADRFAMVVRVPSFTEMGADEQEAILEGRGDESFAITFANAMRGIEAKWEITERELGNHTTRFVRALAGGVANTPFAFEGRRGKLLRNFVLAALALCRAEPGRKTEDTVWAVVQDCLTYHKLAGLELDISQLRTAFGSAFEILKHIGIEALIAQEPTLAGKIGLIVNHLTEVSAVTKADMFGQVLISTDVALQLAAQELVRSQKFANEPAELCGLVERISLPFPSEGIRTTADQLIRFSQMTASEALAFQLCKGNEEKTRALLDQVNIYLTQWGVR